MSYKAARWPDPIHAEFLRLRRDQTFNKYYRKSRWECREQARKNVRAERQSMTSAQSPRG